MVNILIGCTGSVATIKLPLLIQTIEHELKLNESEIQIVVTEHAKHFYDTIHISPKIKVFDDANEWSAWSKRGDPVLHIELGKWADLFLIAPLDANTLAKLANGICDNLLTCTARAWENSKPLIFCPAMNTKMYNHPVTNIHLNLLKSWGYHIIPVIEKTLICGDTGTGAMAEVQDIVNYLKTNIIKKANVVVNV